MAQQDNPQQPTNLPYQSRTGTFGEASTMEKGDLYGGTGKYDVDSLQYPMDLLQEPWEENPYGGNYVVFYINVNEESKLLRDANGRSAAEVVNDTTVRQRGFVVGQNKTTADAITGSAAVGATTGALGKAVNVPFVKSPVIAGAAIGAASAGLVATETSTFSRRQRRMRKAIALHIPAELNIRYTTQWAEEDTAVTAAVSEGFAAAADALGKLFTLNPTGAAESAKQALGSAKSSLTAAALKVGPLGDYISAQTGLTSNPKKEQLFKGVDFRTFNFTYQFFPRDATEAAKVKEIIKAFKLHMHPEFVDDYNFIYVYPSEFDIYYYQGGKENMNLHRHTSCVLVDLSVNYAPQGVFSAFDDGMPTQITVVLTFKELALLTKDFIEDGF